MVETGGYVALALVIVEVLLVFFFARGMTTKTAFVMASFIMFLAVFFWMGNRVTEITIASVGTIKTAVNLATQYVEDTKNIKADAERQKKEAMAAVAELTKELDEARAETRKLTQRMADRVLTDQEIEQIADKIKRYKGQEVQVVTYWDMKEPLALLTSFIHRSTGRGGNTLRWSRQHLCWEESKAFRCGGTPMQTTEFRRPLMLS